jgi:hypothetical protein
MGRYTSTAEYRIDDAQDASNMALQASQWDKYPSLDEQPDEAALAAYLQGLIEKLPETQQDVVNLLMSGVIAVDGPVRSWRSAGRMLGICHKTAKRRLNAALSTLEHDLVTSPAWVRELLLARAPVDAPPVGAASGLPSFDSLLTRVREAS